MAYGQTGSGKTHTMLGTPAGSELGIMYLAAAELFRIMSEKCKERTFFPLKLQYLEIYNNTIRDLLCPVEERTDVQIRANANQADVLSGAREVEIKSVEQVSRIIDEAQGTYLSCVLQQILSRRD